MLVFMKVWDYKNPSTLQGYSLKRGLGKQLGMTRVPTSGIVDRQSVVWYPLRS